MPLPIFKVQIAIVKCLCVLHQDRYGKKYNMILQIWFLHIFRSKFAKEITQWQFIVFLLLSQVGRAVCFCHCTIKKQVVTCKVEIGYNA